MSVHTSNSRTNSFSFREQDSSKILAEFERKLTGIWDKFKQYWAESEWKLSENWAKTEQNLSGNEAWFEENLSGIWTEFESNWSVWVKFESLYFLTSVQMYRLRGTLSSRVSSYLSFLYASVYNSGIRGTWLNINNEIYQCSPSK